MKRRSGVFFSVTSLPSEYGIGGFSRETRFYLETLKTMGFTLWQTLPLCPIGDRESPYDTLCKRAGNYLLIDPTELMEKGLLTSEEIASLRYNGEPYQVNYAHAEWSKKTALSLAFARIDDAEKEKIQSFLKENKDWLADYAFFMAYKERDNKPFYLWEEDVKRRNPKRLAALSSELKERIDYFVFEQYVFYTQWFEIKEYANAIGVEIIGETPFYSSADSVDVWVNQEDFLLKDDLTPEVVAGLPPDFYSENGRIWGCPVYNFNHMKINGFKYLRKEIDHAVTMYDALILHHFRAYYEFYAIKAGDNALLGKWSEGPRWDYIERIKRKYPDYQFIADDLGITNAQVEDFVKRTGFLSMRVMQFAFNEKNSYHLPHFYDSNVIGYTSTKDTNTSLGWLYDTRDEVRRYALAYCNMTDSDWGTGGVECKSNKAIIRTLLNSSCKLAIVPIQDLCGFGSDTRLNNPSSNVNNYRFRLTISDTENIAVFFYQDINRLYGRFD